MFGAITMVWQCDCMKVVRIFLPTQLQLFRSSEFGHARAVKTSDSVVRRTYKIMHDLLQGRRVVFSLDMLSWSSTYPFQQRVLRMESRIPYGMVSTYGRLAARLHNPRAARAVGTALARNPFPIIIPCHRTIRSDRTLGGYAGGLSMKRKLLELEGLQFDTYGRVVTARFW